MYKELNEEQNSLVNRLFIAREEQRVIDMQKYGASVYAPIRKSDVVYELFGITIGDLQENGCINSTNSIYPIDDCPF